jgi:hypothetical protein
MIISGVVPGRFFRPASAPVSVAAKSTTKPSFVGVAARRGFVVPNSWTLVAAKPSPGLAPGMK